jgi:hypothetical protein
MTEDLLIRGTRTASSARTSSMRLLIAPAYANVGRFFRLLSCRPMALSLPL